MKFIVSLLLLCLLTKQPYCQGVIPINANKPRIDSSVFEKWPSVDQVQITNDGKFVSFVIDNDPVGSSTMVIKECIGSWEIRLNGIKSINFSPDSKAFFLIDSHGTLCEFELGTSKVLKLGEANAFSLSSDGKWIAYKSSRDSLTLQNTLTRNKVFYSSVKSFFFGGDGKELILVTKDVIDGASLNVLKWVDMPRLKVTNVWKGSNIGKVILNKENTLLAFCVLEELSVKKAIYIFNSHSNSTNLLMDSIPNSEIENFRIADLLYFGGDNYLYLRINRNVQTPKIGIKNTTVRIWSYSDTRLLTKQQEEVDKIPQYLAAIDIHTHRFVKLYGDNEMIENANYEKGVFLISHTSGGDASEIIWNDSSQRSLHLTVLNQEKRNTLELKKRELTWLSPDGKYVVYYSKEFENYFSYEVESGVTRNITSDLHVNLINKYWEDELPRVRGLAAWIEKTPYVLIYDRFDIWKVDLTGKSRSINITNGFGYRHNTIFDLGLAGQIGSNISNTDSLILVALNVDTKQNGFFRAAFDGRVDPILLSMGNYIYNMVGNPYMGASVGGYPIKAGKAKRYVVLRMSAVEAPNYFFTTNFITFLPLSNLSPQKEYNWLTTELHNWKGENGVSYQGVLYKPENFDSTIKYPIIFHYYDKTSYRLNQYINPEAITGGCNLNIPLFVSNGYLVFTPDINYVVGKPMESALNTVLASAKHLAEFSFVDSNRMGIGGCSFGGVETNYLITHTNIFKAAYSSSGMADLISAYGGLLGGNSSMQSYFEEGQGRMPGPLSRFPEVYIKNSAIFRANFVETPLLLMHTTKDQICSFSQAVEFFTSLRRLGKKVWLLEYMDGNHIIWGESAKDFGIRLGQFFDHYLKDAPAPTWMTKGVPWKMRNIDDGLKLDTESKSPSASLLRD